VDLPSVRVLGVVLSCAARYTTGSVGRLMGRAAWSYSNFTDRSSLHDSMVLWFLVDYYLIRFSYGYINFVPFS
jgi:hypothetical protein